MPKFKFNIVHKLRMPKLNDSLGTAIIRTAKISQRILGNRMKKKKKKKPPYLFGRVFNFRDGLIPEGVSLQGQTEKWQEEKDGSQTLVLIPMSYLKCDLVFPRTCNQFDSSLELQSEPRQICE